MITPASRSNVVCHGLTVPIVSPVVMATSTSCTTASGASHAVSSVRPDTASTFGPTRFLMSP